MSEDSNIDAGTGLMNRQAFLREARLAQENLPVSVRRGCLLIIRFPTLLSLLEKQGEAALNDALKHLLAIVETRLRSRDMLGRISVNSFCLLLKQCKEADAVVVADQYVALLSDVVIDISGTAQPLDLSYRIVPLDLAGTRSKQGTSKVIKTPLASTTKPLVKQLQVSTNHVDLSRSKIVSLSNLRHGLSEDKPEIGRVIRLPSSPHHAAPTSVSWRLRPGMLINRKSLVCCLRLQQVGIREAPVLLQRSRVFASVLKALSLNVENSRPTIESQLILQVQANQIDDDFPGWVTKRCEMMRIAPSDICLSLSFESLSEDLRVTAPRLRLLNRRGLRLMAEGLDSVIQLKSLFKLARFDYLYISERTFNDSTGQRSRRLELESLIRFANEQHCEICSGGVDTKALIEHATSLGVEIGFGRACGKSVPFPDQAVRSTPSS